MMTYANRLEIEQNRKENRDKMFARGQVKTAVKNGTLKKEPCYCGETKVEGHHPDYSNPLEVIWACRKHHGMLDKMRHDAHITD